MKFRTPTRASKYWTEPRLYKHAISWCLCYPLWKKELESLPDASKAIDYAKDKVQTSNDYDATAELAFKRVELEHKVNILETTAKIVAPDMYEWIIKGVTEENMRVEDLIAQGMPCSKNVYFRLRQQFYHLISKRI